MYIYIYIYPHTHVHSNIYVDIKVYIYIYIFDITLITFKIKYHRMKDIGKNIELTLVYPKIFKPKNNQCNYKKLYLGLL